MSGFLRPRELASAGPSGHFGGLLVVLTLLLVLAVGLMILSVLVAGGLVLACWVWWWRRRLLQSAMKNPLVIEGECQILDLGHTTAMAKSKDGAWNSSVRRRSKL